MDEYIVGLPEVENKLASSDKKCRGMCGLIGAVPFLTHSVCYNVLKSKLGGKKWK